MSKETKLLIVCVLVSLSSFIIALYFQKIWLALFLALLCGVGFLVRLTFMGKEKFESRSSYMTMLGLVITIILFQALSFGNDYLKRDFQKDLLLEIRKTIDEGIQKVEIEANLVHVLAVYKQENKDSIIETYKELNPERLQEDGIYISDYDINESKKPEAEQEPNGDDINHFYELDEEEDEIRFIVISEVSLGEDPEYENYDGQTGKFEMMFVLNEEGVEYEVLN